MKRMMRLSFSFALLCLGTTSTSSAFTVAPRYGVLPSARIGVAPLASSNSDREDRTGEDVADSNTSKRLDGEVRSKLLAESIAPWRTLRLFLYGSFASGAAVGGFITLTGAIAAVSAGKEDLDLNVEYLNLAIDFGAVALFAFLAKFDLDKSVELDDRVADKLERTKGQKAIAKAMREREATLANLDVQIKVSADGTTTTARLGDLQAGAKQHVILVAGPRRICKEALIGANLLKMDFAMSNVLVVPYRTDQTASDTDPTQTKPIGSGFGDDDASYANQPYVGRSVGEGWSDYIQGEIDDAVRQNGAEDPEKKGIVIVIANNGNVIRRGIGTVPWRQMVDQLNEEAAPGSQKPAINYLFDN